MCDDRFVKIKISTKCLRHHFNCTEEFITTVCKGRCCQGSKRILVSLLPQEQKWHESQGHKVIDGVLQAHNNKRCHHREENGFCSLHGTPNKPFGCIASPFILNKKNTLVIRHRYFMFKCHGYGEYAYKVFKASLDLLFGEKESDRIYTAMELGADDFYALMPIETYKKVKHLSSTIKRKIVGEKLVSGKNIVRRGFFKSDEDIVSNDQIK